MTRPSGGEPHMALPTRPPARSALTRAPASPQRADGGDGINRAPAVPGFRTWRSGRDTDGDGYAVRVDFRTGDHDFWGWRPTTGRAQRLRRRYTTYFRGYGIAAMTVVPISRTQFGQHTEYSRCRAGNCSTAADPP